MVHVRFEGKSYDLQDARLGVQSGYDDQQIKAQLARYFDVGIGWFEAYVVDRPQTGVLIVRPEAVYG